MNDSGTPEVKPHSVANGVQLQSSSQTPEKVASAAKSSPAWDDDWGSPSKDSAVRNSQHVTNNQVNKSSNQSQPSTTSTFPNKATAPTTCPPVDIEWPPRQSSSLTTPAIADETQLNTCTSSTPGFDELDPFANWPPRPNNGTSVASTGLNNGISSGFSNNLTAGTPFQTASNDNWTFSNASLSSMKPPQQRQSQGVPSFSSGSNNSQKPADISSIFSSSKTGQPAMKLAPPPSTTMGRGRGKR